MNSGRIEGDHRDAFAGIAKTTPSVLARAKPSETAPIASAEPVSYGDFETLIDIAGRRASAATVRSPHQCVADFVMPRISDPTVFQGRGTISILERLAWDIIPALDENAELRSLAGAIIGDEIERHRELLMQLHGGITR